MIKLLFGAICSFFLVITVLVSANLSYSIGNRHRLEHNHQLVCRYIAETHIERQLNGCKK